MIHLMIGILFFGIAFFVSLQLEYMKKLGETVITWLLIAACTFCGVYVMFLV